MPAWLTLPLLVDLILLGMLCEVGWLVWRTKPITLAPPPPLLLHVVSGALLLVGMKLALSEASPSMVGLVLGLAGVTHIIDLRINLKR